MIRNKIERDSAVEMEPPKVLMVAGNSAIALRIASAISGGGRSMSTRRGSTEVHEFKGTFLGIRANFKVTSVEGQVFSVDSPSNQNDWAETDSLNLFSATIVKSESDPKADKCRHLSQEASGCEHLVLWLNCDPVGENICFQVMASTGFDVNEAWSRVHRARFSSLTKKDIHKAFNNLVKPIRDSALSVDAQQEIDMKVGVAFSRFQIGYFQEKYKNLESGGISYGPRETPTLGFCVERHLQIKAFKPETFWVLRPLILKDGDQFLLDWDREKVFDSEVAKMLRDSVLEDATLVVTRVSPEKVSESRPPVLNKMNMFKAASTVLGYEPQVTMQLADYLYSHGFISYPNTESTAYPASFDVKSTLEMLLHNPTLRGHVQALLDSGFHQPEFGTDAGEHPPITPVRAATENMLPNDSWRLYQYICQHFIGSVSPDCEYMRTEVELSSGGELFYLIGREVGEKKGFASVMPWLAVTEKKVPQLTVGDKVTGFQLILDMGKTSPPNYLSKGELISIMEKNGFGLNASVSVHIINDICKRKYVEDVAGRLVPTTLGTTLIKGYLSIDPDLCLPDISSYIEQQITLIAKGEVDYSHVVHHVLQQFMQKFSYFVKQIDTMDALFKVQFSRLGGRLLSKCGKCERYMKYISTEPACLFCATCKDLYRLPQNGRCELFSEEFVCPLDNFNLLIFYPERPDAKFFFLCPYCYNNAKVEDIEESAGKLDKGVGTSCLHCPHYLTCESSITPKRGVHPDIEKWVSLPVSHIPCTDIKHIPHFFWKKRNGIFILEPCLCVALDRNDIPHMELVGWSASPNGWHQAVSDAQYTEDAIGRATSARFGGYIKDDSGKIWAITYGPSLHLQRGCRLHEFIAVEMVLRLAIHRMKRTHKIKFIQVVSDNEDVIDMLTEMQRKIPHITKRNIRRRLEDLTDNDEEIIVMRRIKSLIEDDFSGFRHVKFQWLARECIPLADLLGRIKTGKPFFKIRNPDGLEDDDFYEDYILYFEMRDFLSQIKFRTNFDQNHYIRFFEDAPFEFVKEKKKAFSGRGRYGNQS